MILEQIIFAIIFFLFVSLLKLYDKASYFKSNVDKLEEDIKDLHSKTQTSGSLKMKNVAIKVVPDYASLLMITNPSRGELYYVSELNKVYIFNPMFNQKLGWSPIEPTTRESTSDSGKLCFVCDFCDGRFFDMSLHNCPNCGAPLKTRRV